MTDYQILNEQLAALVGGVPHQTANLANAAALLYHTLDGLNWAGFYLLEEDTLVLGPFQGKPACIEIPVGRGVCGTAVAEDKTQLVQEEGADVVRSIFEYYLAGASLGKIVDMLFTYGIFSPTGNPKWTRAAVDILLANKKYVPIVGIEVYLDAQFEKDHRCNVDYDKAGHPRNTAKYQFLSFEMK